ncbi:MAG TPA: hypothetical protein VM140_13330 [Burkholderiales bacterium]|nr:hypothetical protein [Burkholderiales bacterium]
MRTFHVRPESDAGYGRGDGSSYADAWNGLKGVDWAALRGAPAVLRVCGSPENPAVVVIVQVEWGSLQPKNSTENDVDSEIEKRTDPRREPSVSV